MKTFIRRHGLTFRDVVDFAVISAFIIKLMVWAIVFGDKSGGWS